jgi:hypothetical protein
MVDHAHRVDYRIDHHEQRRGHQQGPLHAPEKVPARSAFDGGRFAQARVQALQRGQVEDHEEAGFLPDRHQRHGAQCRSRVAQPVVGRQAEQPGDLLQQAVSRRVEKQPDVGHGDHGQYGRREIGHAQETAPGHALVDPQGHHQRQPDGKRNGAQREPQVVGGGLPEHRVVDHHLVVFQADPHPGAGTLGCGIETVNQRGDGRVMRECHQQHEGRQQQQIGVDRVGTIGARGHQAHMGH